MMHDDRPFAITHTRTQAAVEAVAATGKTLLKVGREVEQEIG